MGWGHTATDKRPTESMKLNQQALDQDWVNLILTAREYGLSVEEIRSFLRKVAASD